MSWKQCRGSSGRSQGVKQCESSVKIAFWFKFKTAASKRNAIHQVAPKISLVASDGSAKIVLAPLVRLIRFCYTYPRQLRNHHAHQRQEVNHEIRKVVMSIVCAEQKQRDGYS